MSDTPKTDAIAERFGHGPLDPNDAVEQYNDLLDLARQLERELKQWMDDGAHLYCTTCGSCGEDGCCSPGKCWGARYEELKAVLFSVKRIVECPDCNIRFDADWREKDAAYQASQKNAAPQVAPSACQSDAGSAQAGQASPAVAASCAHPWLGVGAQPSSFMCRCGTKVYRSYEDYCDD